LPLLFWDASALAKRYVPEVGNDTVDALFALTPAPRMYGTILGYAETYSTLLGLNTLNPEGLAAADVPAFIAAL
jgi:hypothetical protein